MAGMVALVLTGAARAEDPWLRRTGDLLRGLLPLAALSVALQKEDREGVEQLALTLASSELTTEGLKRAFNDTGWGRRPNGGRYSFPSGHATTACSSAAFLGERYGWHYGGPALLPATVVAYSRIDADVHHWRDVAAGCAIGAGYATGIVKRRDQAVDLQVRVMRDSVALSLSLPL